MSTPVKPLPQNSYAAFGDEPPPPPTIDPDNPPWGVGAALLAWLASVALLVVMQAIAVVPYLVYSRAGFTQINDAITDPNVVLISVISVIPAHLMTLVIVWAIVSQFGKRPFWRTLGWSWSANFGFWTSSGLAVALLFLGALIAYFAGGEKTPFEQMLESSDTARFTTAFLAVATAPLIEELIYRGMLYPAVQRVTGMFWAVIIVATLFTFVHIAQYINNYGVIATIALLSFVLTYIRARTGRLLPCFVIHLVFNGLQVAALVFQYFQPVKPGGETKTALVLFIMQSVGLPF